MRVQTKVSSNALWFLAVTFALGGCSTVETQHADETVYSNVQRAVEWGIHDQPSILSNDFEYTFSELPTAGEVEQTPWTGSYWPTYRDNINYRWAGPESDSPAKKYEKAFGRTDLEDRVSKHFGIDSAPNYKLDSCTKEEDCEEEGSVCAKRFEAEEGYCVPTWWGVCHAWAPAAIMEKEPEQAVEHNGVTFQINDLKALISLSYTAGLATDFLSLRCNKNDDKEEIEYNEYGIPKADECADTNAGTFHVVVANMMGIQKKSFIYTWKSSKTYAKCRNS